MQSFIALSIAPTAGQVGHPAGPAAADPCGNLLEVSFPPHPRLPQLPLWRVAGMIQQLALTGLSQKDCTPRLAMP